MGSQGDSRGTGKSKSAGGCHYLPGLLAVPQGRAGEARDALRGDGLRQAQEITEETIERYAPGLARRGDRLVEFVSVPERLHEAATLLANRGRLSSPIHGVGYEGHGGYMSGDGPSRTGGLSLEAPEEGEREGWIAVVDSGLVEEGARPEWIREPHVKDFSTGPEVINAGDEQDDIEYASHGTFVTSVIRKIAPEFGVLFSAAPPDEHGELEPTADDDDFPRPTTELDVLGAVDRLVAGIHDSGIAPHEVRGLNLSLGAPRCRSDDGFLLTLRAAVDLWRQYFGNHAPIFAAGGNSDDPSRVYPAAFDRVRGVGAGKDREQKVWNDGTALTATTRTWIDDVAPGLKLLGAGGLGESDTVEWSGSSFASAVATALYSRGASFEIEDGVVFWRDRDVRYDNVPGLKYA